MPHRVKPKALDFPGHGPSRTGPPGDPTRLTRAARPTSLRSALETHLQPEAILEPFFRL
jgi:hypothetical protein